MAWIPYGNRLLYRGGCRGIDGYDEIGIFTTSYAQNIEEGRWCGFLDREYIFE